jgi:hypothetical protein
MDVKEKTQIDVPERRIRFPFFNLNLAQGGVSMKKRYYGREQIIYALNQAKLARWRPISAAKEEVGEGAGPSPTSGMSGRPPVHSQSSVNRPEL